MLIHAQDAKTDAAVTSLADKRQESLPVRSRMIRLDRHIRQAEVAELLKGRV